jgi:hypothetical protein
MPVTAQNQPSPQAAVNNQPKGRLVQQNGKWVVSGQPATAPKPAVKSSGINLDTIKSFLQQAPGTFVAGAKTGIKELVANLLQNQTAVGVIDPTGIGKKEAAAGKQLQTQTATEKLADLKSKSAGYKVPIINQTPQQLLYGFGEVAPAALLPIGGEDVEGASLLSKVLTGAAQNAAQMSLLYNPADHPQGNQLENYLSDTAANFVMGAAFHVVLAPMKGAAGMVRDTLNQYLNPDAYDAMAKDFSTNLKQYTKEEFSDVMRGVKPVQNFDLFKSDQWKNLVKQYGVNIDNYPDDLFREPDAPVRNPTVEAAIAPKLPADDLHVALADEMDRASTELSLANNDGYQESNLVISAMTDALEGKGYTVDKTKLAQGVLDMANYKREFQDSNAQVLTQERDKSVYRNLDNNGLLKPLMQVRRLYRVVQNQPDYTDQKVADRFLTWAKENNFGGFDELSDQLRKAGINIPVNAPEKLIGFALSLPTKEDITRGVKFPEPLDPAKLLNDAVTPKAEAMEVPYARTQAEFDKLKQPQQDPINTQDLRDEILKAKDKQFKQNQSPPPKTPPVGSSPNLHNLIDKAAGVVQEIRSRIEPANISEQSKEASFLLREYNSMLANDKVRNTRSMAQMEGYFQKMPTDQHLQLLNNYETTGIFSPDLQKFSQYYKEMTDKSYTMLQDAYPDFQGYVDNYIRHAFNFKDKETQNKFTQSFAKSMGKFSTSPLKQRKFVTIKDAMDYMTQNNIPFNLVESNPVRLLQWTIDNAKAAQGFAFVKQELKDRSLVRFVKFGEHPLPNEKQLNDRWAQVFFKGEQGMVQAGSYVAPNEVATVLNNAVSKGMMDIFPTTFSAWRGFQNTLNQFQLGLSLFHASTTSFNSIASEMGLSFQELLGGAPQKTKALQSFFTSPAAPVMDFMKGYNFIHALDKMDPAAQKVLDEWVNPAGARIRLSSEYRTRGITRFNKALQDNKKIVAGLNAPFAFMEWASKPIMEGFVPRVKVGRFLTEAESGMFRITKGYTQEVSQMDKVKMLTDIADKIDNIHGQLVQDNLFWSQMQKDVANSSARSFGWSYGSLRVAGNAAKNILQIPANVKAGKDWMTPSLGVVLAYPVIAGLAGAIFYYLNNGKAPQSATDIYFPANGSFTADGSPIRVSVPGYMKDFFSYARDPLSTLLNKTAPSAQMASELLTNKDFYGVMIRNPDDPLVKQAEETGMYLLSELEPFSIQSFSNILSSSQGNSKAANAKDLLEGFLGFQKASNVATDTKAQRDISNTYSGQIPSGVLTPEAETIMKAKSAAKQAAMQGNYQLLEKLLQEHVYTLKGYTTEVTNIHKQKAKGYDAFQEMFSKLPAAAQQRIYKEMTKSEQEKYKKELKVYNPAMQPTI